MRARARKAEIALSDKEVKEHNLDHAVCRKRCTGCVKGGAESCGHARRVKGEGAVPTIGVGYVCNIHTCSERGIEEEKGVQIRSGIVRQR